MKVKKLALKRNDVAPIVLLIVSLIFMAFGLFFKSLIVLAGVTGLVCAWFLCIDNLIANYNMNMIKRIIFGGIIILMPVAIAFYMGA